MTDNIKKKPLHARTISADLHREWKKLKRQGDSEKLREILGISKPTIDRALIYGNVHQDRIVETITNFFLGRIAREKQTAEVLKTAAETNKTKIS